VPEGLRRTKLFRPLVRRYLVPRRRLTARLESQRQAGIRFALVSAPAGSGKSTLVSQWTGSTDLPTAWLTLDKGDNDPVRFWRYLLAALRTAEPRLGAGLEGPLSSLPPPPIANVVTELINDIIEVGAEVFLVLEDYHLIENPEVQASVDSLLENLPPQLHLVITTRSDPPLRLAHLRGQGSMAEVRAEDLRFTPEETAAFVDLMRLDLTTEDVLSLGQRTEGWITGLQMAALSLLEEPDRHAFIQAFQGDDRHVADYLIEEVLQHQPPEAQRFLLQTSILGQLSAPLCDAVTGGQDGAEMLQALEHANLFIFPLDNRREWFRYHTLFAHLLRRRLVQAEGEEVVGRLQSRALTWIEGHRPVAEAIDYALDCSMYTFAADLMVVKAGLFFTGGELNTLVNLAGRLPKNLVAERLPLGCALAWAAQAAGHPTEAEHYIRLVERRAGRSVDDFVDNIEDPSLAPHARSALIEVAVARARIAVDRFDVTYAFRVAERLLPYMVPELDNGPVVFNLPSAYRGPTLFILGLAMKLHGDVNSSISMLEDSVAEGRRVGNSHIVALASGHLGEAQVLHGQLRQARHTWTEALDIPPEMLRVSAFFGMSHIGLGNLACEWNDLETAETRLQAGLQQGRWWNSWECLLPGYLGLARLRAAAGNWSGAFLALDELMASTQENQQLVGATVESHRALLSLRSGDLSSAVQWADHFAPERPRDYILAWEHDALVRCRVWFAQGRAEESLSLLEQILGDSRQAGRLGHWLQAACLKSLLLDAAHQQEEAMLALRSALEVARPEGYLRLFVDEGEKLRPLLHKVVSASAHDDLGMYANSILQAYGPPSRKPTAAQDLVEPLTDRELEVLGYMAQGIPNLQIAKSLYISPNTLKAHCKSIFAKLHVHTRLQAVNKAKKASLIREG